MNGDTSSTSVLILGIGDKTNSLYDYRYIMGSCLSWAGVDTFSSLWSLERMHNEKSSMINYNIVAEIIKTPGAKQ